MSQQLFGSRVNEGVSRFAHPCSLSLLGVGARGVRGCCGRSEPFHRSEVVRAGAWPAGFPEWDDRHCRACLVCPLPPRACAACAKGMQGQGSLPGAPAGAVADSHGSCGGAGGRGVVAAKGAGWGGGWATSSNMTGIQGRPGAGGLGLSARVCGLCKKRHGADFPGSGRHIVCPVPGAFLGVACLL